MRRIYGILTALAIGAALASCSGVAPRSDAAKPAVAATAKKGGYYLDDGPHANPPANLDAVPDAVPRREPLHRYANRSYVALGNSYTPDTKIARYREEGLASWYGKRFHGKKTASGEPYDMYAMTAAHRTLPIPSYVRVTATASGKSVVVRINDRGPFSKDRVIDLSYTAAHKLGVLGRGSLRVRVESLVPDDSTIGGVPSQEGIYLQLGAFAQRENAVRLLEKIQVDTELSRTPAPVAPRGDLHCVALGPYASAAEAESGRMRVQQQFGLQAVQRHR